MEENKNIEQESNSAKRLKALGEVEENIHSPEHNNVEVDKFSNFWYYHKWKVIIGAVFAILLVVFIAIMANKKENDVQLIYAGPVDITNNLSDMQNAFASLEVDFDKDNTGRVLISKYICKSKEDMEKEKEEANKEGIEYNDAQQIAINSQEKQTFNQVIMSGEFSVMLISSTLYEENKANLCDIYSILGNDVDSSIVVPGAKGIYFKETKFAKENPCFDILPDDTVLCILVKTYNVKDKDYENRQEFLKSIIEY